MAEASSDVYPPLLVYSCTYTISSFKIYSARIIIRMDLPAQARMKSDHILMQTTSLLQS